MKTQSTLPLTTPPDESLRLLQRAVAQRSNWRILTGGANHQPRFVIEKRVRYDLVRGLPMVALYQVMGGFQKSTSGETTLRYTVSGDASIPFMHAASLIAVWLVLTFFLPVSSSVQQSAGTG